ncbi:MAG: hypothetical protein ABSA52_07655 [Candidatus Binatia bacterium]|jgi:hypothetical protein
MIRKCGLRQCLIAVVVLISAARHIGGDTVPSVQETRQATADRPRAAVGESDRTAATEVLGILTKGSGGTNARASEIAELKEYVARNPPSHEVAVAELLIGHALSESRDETERQEAKEYLRQVLKRFPGTRELRLAEVDFSLLEMVEAAGGRLTPPSDALHTAWGRVRDAASRALPDYRALDSATDPLMVAARRRLGWSEQQPLTAAAEMRIAQLTIGVEGFKQAEGLLHALVTEYGGTPSGKWAEGVLKAYAESAAHPLGTPREGRQ